MKRIISIIVATAIMCSVLTNSIYADSDTQAKFKDVKTSDWFAEAVGKMNALRIIDGMPGGSFNPQGAVTRAQFVKMLVQAMGYQKIDSISFEDLKPFKVSKPHWSCVYIETALRNGVISKDEVGSSFFPDAPLMRKDMGMMMFKALTLSPSDGENPFADLTEADGSFTKLYEEYLIRGNVEGGKRLFKAEGLTTRAEAAVIIARMVEYKENPQGFAAKSAMEERFENGTYTEEDLTAKAKIELAKQAADKEYIPEPIIKIEYNPSEYRYARVTLVNVDDYGDEYTFKRVCTNYSDLNRSGGENYFGRYREVEMTRIITAKEAKSSFVEIPKRNAKLVNGKTVYYDYGFEIGKEINYKILISRGNVTKQIVLVLTIQ